MRFFKYEGLGNDFILFDVSPETLSCEARDAVIAMCDRHLGVGADGVLLTGIDQGVPFMRVYNADGSQPEMCGNGLRCVALYLAQHGLVQDSEFAVRTDAGLHTCKVLDSTHTGLVEVQMRAPSFVPADVPVLREVPVIDEPIDVDGRALRITVLSMGNPHAVTFDDVGNAREVLGPLVERNPMFPSGVNVEFARVEGPLLLSVEVWERGVGFTRACGTGACAVAAAAVRTGLLPPHERITVRLPGGVLTIQVGEATDPVLMIGPARHVFDGTVESPRLREVLNDFALGRGVS